MIIIIQILSVPVLLYLDQIHLLLLVITTIVSKVTQELLLMVYSIHQTCCGICMVVIMLLTTAVLTLTCLGSSNNFHAPFKIILKQGSAVMNHLVMNILLWKVLNCTYNDIMLINAFTIIDTLIFCI